MTNLTILVSDPGTQDRKLLLKNQGHPQQKAAEHHGERTGQLEAIPLYKCIALYCILGTNNIKNASQKWSSSPSCTI